MRGPYKYEKLNKYPHLSLHEAPIWEKFIDQFPDFCDKVYYDVEVGGVRGDTSKLNERTKKNAEYLGKYKIDVLCETADYFTIIELKKEATTKAIGEIALYYQLYNKDFKPEKPVLRAIITDEEMPNIREYCEVEGISLYVV